MLLFGGGRALNLKTAEEKSILRMILRRTIYGTDIDRHHWIQLVEIYPFRQLKIDNF